MEEDWYIAVSIEYDTVFAFLPSLVNLVHKKLHRDFLGPWIHFVDPNLFRTFYHYLDIKL